MNLERVWREGEPYVLAASKDVLAIPALAATSLLGTSAALLGKWLRLPAAAADGGLVRSLWVLGHHVLRTIPWLLVVLGLGRKCG